MLHKLRKVGRGFAWAVERNPRAIDKRLWQARNVEILPMEIDQFIEQLEALP